MIERPCREVTAYRVAISLVSADPSERRRWRWVFMLARPASVTMIWIKRLHRDARLVRTRRQGRWHFANYGF